MRLPFRFLSALLVGGLSLAHSESTCDPVRVLIHLLDYVGQDYAGAVKDGKVLSIPEYEEQKEFTGKAWETRTDLKDTALRASIEPDLAHLQQLVLEKAAPDSIEKVSREIKQRLIGVSGIATAPSHWPDFSEGRRAFKANCVLCHGPEGRGDGPAGAALDPKPANFHSEERMAALSPFQVFNTIRLGVPGTAMPAFPKLSEQEIWNLAFFVLSLKYTGDSAVAARSHPLPGMDLHRLSLSSDKELLAMHPEATRVDLAAWRLQSAEPVGTLTHYLELAVAGLDQALALYRNGEKEKSADTALFAYLDGIEPLEPRLRSTDPRFVGALEQAMLKVRSAIREGKSDAQVELQVGEAKQLLAKAGGLLHSNPLPPMAVFLITIGILLRESFEALLVIIAILGVLKASGTHKAQRYVHGGWIFAVLAGFAAWAFSGWVARLSGAGRELTEGLSSIFALLVLLYMGFWMHGKSEIDKWNAFIKTRLQAILDGKSLLGLGVFSFVVVFREAFETVLFLSALNVEGKGMGLPILGGALTAIAVTLVVAWIFLRASARIPVRKFFLFSSFVMAFLAFLLAGKGFHALQEAGHMSVTPTPWNFRWEFLGIFPTLETTLAQGVVLLISIAMLRNRKKDKAALKPKAMMTPG